MKIDLNCNFKCWECSQEDCNLKQLYLLPENMFYSIILDSLKSRAGIMLVSGYSKEFVDNNLKETAVTIKISRELYLNKHSKKS